MAEISSGSKLSLWPKLKKKIGSAAKKTTKKKQKVNPFASQGLEKFAVLMSELQAKKASLVDKTGNSVSAARYLSRSAQEWTATTLARTASRCRERESPKASALLLQQTSSPSNPHLKERVEIETIDFSQSFSFPDPRHETQDGSYGFGFGPEALIIGDLKEETASTPISLEDAEKSEERRASCGGLDVEEKAGCSGRIAGSASLPERSERLIRNGQLLMLEKGWARSPSSVFALLVALGACLGGRVTKLGNSVVELLILSVMVRLQKGKTYAQLLRSLVSRHIVPYFSIRVPRGLTLLPLVSRKTSTEPGANSKNSEGQTGELPKPEIKSDYDECLGVTLPVALESSSSPLSPVDNCPASAILPRAEASDDSPRPLIKVSTSFLTPASSPDRETSSPTRRFVKKLSSKLKSKASRSSPPASSAPGSPLSDSCITSGGLSSRRHSRSFFSRRDKEKELLEDSSGWPTDEVFSDGNLSSKRRCIMAKKCSFRKDKTPEPSISKSSVIRKSPLGRMSSSKAMDPASSADITSSSSSGVFDVKVKNFELLLTVGLLVALTFLVVSRFSAIVATSVMFLVLSYVYKDSSYPARKVQRSPPVRGRLG
uniref:Uncharacterized protein n=1 Tax=Physcomitrium patens TaxID=3218 RepID=A0A2K1JGS5_PHYPA|nr:hypothetical protein PHYPA_018166 [Physcomitrium patens]